MHKKSEINTLIVKGNKTCFKPDFTGKDIRLVVE